MKKNILMASLWLVLGSSSVLGELHGQESSGSVQQLKELKSFFEEGKSLYAQKNFPQALKIFLQVLSLDASYQPAQDYVRLCQQHIQWSDRENETLAEIGRKEAEADQRLQKEQSIEQMSQKAMILLKERQFALAIQEFQNILTIDPERSWVKDYIQLCQESMAWEDKVKDIQLELQRKALLNDHDLFEQGKQKFVTKDYEEAYDIFQKVLQINPQHSFAQDYLQLCEKIIKYKKLEEQKQLDQLQKSVMQELSLYEILQTYAASEKLLEKGRTLFNAQKYYPALEFFRNVGERYPENKIVKDYIRLCEKSIEFEQKQVQAQTDVAMVLLRHKNIENNLEEGKKLYDEGKYVGSIEAMNKVLKEVPQHALALKYIDLNQQHLALAQLKEKADLEQKEWLLQWQKNVEADQQKAQFVTENLKKGIEFFERKQYAPALQRFQAVLEQDPKHRVAREYADLSQRYLNIDDQQELDRVVRLKNELENQSRSLFQIGKELFEQEQYEQAIVKLTAAWQQSPDAPFVEDIQKYIERSFKQVGLKQKKEQEQEQKVQTEKYQEAFRKAIEAYEAQNYSSALELLRKALALRPADLQDSLELYVKKTEQALDSQKIAARQQELSQLYARALAQYQQQHWKDALRLFGDVYAKDPAFQDVSLYMKISNEQWQQQQRTPQS